MQFSYWCTCDIHFPNISVNPVAYCSSYYSRVTEMFLGLVLFFQHLLCQDRFKGKCFKVVVKILGDGGSNQRFQKLLEEVGA